MDTFDLRKFLAESKLQKENPNQLDIFSPITVNIDKDVSIGRDYYNKVWLEFRENWARQNGIKYKSSNELNSKIIDHFKIPYPEKKNFPDSAEWLEDQGILKIQAEGRLTNEGFFGTSYEKEERKLEDALDRFVKYSIEKNGDFEDEVESTLEKKARDAVSIYMGGKIDSDKLDKMYTDVMSKVPDYVMQRGEDEVKKMKKNG